MSHCYYRRRKGADGLQVTLLLIDITLIASYYNSLSAETAFVIVASGVTLVLSNEHGLK